MSWPTCSRRLLGLLALLAACAPSPSEREWAPAAELSCPVVAVDNQGFEDVVVYHEPLNRRIGVVGGVSRRAFEDCQLVGQAPRFYVRAIGGAWARRLEGVHRLERGTGVVMVIAPSPNLSYVTE